MHLAELILLENDWNPHEPVVIDIIYCWSHQHWLTHIIKALIPTQNTSSGACSHQIILVTNHCEDRPVSLNGNSVDVKWFVFYLAEENKLSAPQLSIPLFGWGARQASSYSTKHDIGLLPCLKRHSSEPLRTVVWTATQSILTTWMHFKANKKYLWTPKDQTELMVTITRST